MVNDTKEREAKRGENPQDVRMPVTSHLSELRDRLIYSLIAVSIGFALTFSYSQSIINWLRRPLNSDLVFLSPAEAFWTNLKVSFFAGLFITIPFVLYQVWRFIAPGLLPKEKQYALPFVVLSTVFFFLGLSFCYFIVLPFAIGFLLTYKTEGLKAMISVGMYVDFIIKFLLAFGLIFELPLAITLLARIGLLTPQFLTTNRKYAVLGCFIVSAILTPTPDIFNQSLMAIPMIVLYEIGVLGARLFGKGE